MKIIFKFSKTQYYLFCTVRLYRLFKEGHV